jgi:hypothetical protein
MPTRFGTLLQMEEELDLIHYAMVGGMSGNELPNEQVRRFEQWFGLPAI